MGYVDLFLDLKNRSPKMQVNFIDCYLRLNVMDHRTGYIQTMDTKSTQGERTVVKDTTAIPPNS